MSDILSKAEKSLLNVWIADPDSELSQILIDHLAQQGFAVGLVSSPAELVAKLDAGAPDNLIVLLQDNEQGEVIKAIRKDRPLLPEIVLLSENPKMNLFQAHQLGACDLLPKPLTFHKLNQTLQKIGQLMIRHEARATPRIQLDPMHTPFPRTAMFGQVSFETPAAVSEKISVTNLGRGGFFFEAKKVSDLELTIVPGCHIKGQGIVRWVKSEKSNTKDTVGAGVEFLEIPAEARDLIAAFVQLFREGSYLPGYARAKS